MIPMKTILKIEKKENCRYLINGAGEIIEVSTEVRKLGEITKLPNHVYSIMNDGTVVEKELLTLDPETYYRYKSDGTLAKLFREGKEVEINQENATLEQLQELEDTNSIAQLQGMVIQEVRIIHEDGNREFRMTLSNGKTLKLKEGLLSGSSVIEVE